MEKREYTFNDQSISHDEYYTLLEDGTYRQYHSSGALYMEEPYKNGVPHGIHKTCRSQFVEEEIFLCGNRRDDINVEEVKSNRLLHVILFGVAYNDSD